MVAKEAGEMLYLKRKIDAFLAEWKANPDRKPLIVKGPRQVGKTESIKRFWRDELPERDHHQLRGRTEV